MTFYEYLKDKFVKASLAEIFGILDYIDAEDYDRNLTYRIELPSKNEDFSYLRSVREYLDDLRLTDNLFEHIYEKVFRVDIYNSQLRIAHAKLDDRFGERNDIQTVYENLSSSCSKKFFREIWAKEKEFYKQEEERRLARTSKPKPGKKTMKEGINMNASKLFPALKCGKVEGDMKMCHLGVAAKNAEGVYVAFDKTNKTIVDVDVASFDGGDFLYQIPVQTKDIALNDCILHNGAPCIVIATAPILKVISLTAGTEDTVKLTTNMFGFNFVTKIVSMMDLAGLTGGTGGDMTAMLPLLMLSGDNNSNSDDTLKAIMMMQMMQQNNTQQTNTNNMFNNPMMFALLAGDGKMDAGMLLAMSMMQQPAANAANTGANTPTV